MASVAGVRCQQRIGRHCTQSCARSHKQIPPWQYSLLHKLRLRDWELVAHQLAAKAGIVVPEARPLQLQESPYTTLLVKRCDRTAPGGRLAFVSAMTLTQHEDGVPGASYIE